MKDIEKRLIKGAAGLRIAALTAGGLGFISKAEAAKKSSAELPYPYKKFTAAEIKEAGNIAHAAWFKGFCSYATLSGGLTILRRKVGGPYNSFPMELTTFAHGGTSGWGEPAERLLEPVSCLRYVQVRRSVKLLIMRFAISMRRQRFRFLCPITRRLSLKQQAPAIHLSATSLSASGCRKRAWDS
jgi:hypothetical protein